MPGKQTPDVDVWLKRETPRLWSDVQRFIAEGRWRTIDDRPVFICA